MNSHVDATTYTHSNSCPTVVTSKRDKLVVHKIVLLTMAQIKKKLWDFDLQQASVALDDSLLRPQYNHQLVVSKQPVKYNWENTFARDIKQNSYSAHTHYSPPS